MKRLGPFLLALSLLVALGVLVSGSEMSGTGASSSHPMVVDEEILENAEQDLLSSGPMVLCAEMGLDPFESRSPFTGLSFVDVSSSRRASLFPVGWRLPIRI